MTTRRVYKERREHLSITMPKRTKEALEELAAKQDRTLSSLVTIIVQGFFESKKKLD